MFSFSTAQTEKHLWKKFVKQIGETSDEFVIAQRKKSSNDIFSVADAVKDDEIENWAAKKIQSSFKQYKHQKSTREKMLPPTSEVSLPPSPTS